MMTTTIKKINQEKTHQKHASNVEAAAMKHSQEKKMPPYLSINVGAGDAQICLQMQ